MLNNKSILITGGTGSFGNAMVKLILAKFSPKKLIILSRDELKQYNMRQQFSKEEDEIMRYFLGDVRDEARLVRAFQGVDVVIHAAALKQVPAAEYNPSEFIKTNIMGAENVISAALKCGVERVVALSTDKAAAPINLYGATKLCSDKLFVAANNIRGPREIGFSVVRYGNVMGSRGSVIPFFLKQRETSTIPVTDERMTRFNITLDDACRMVLYAIEHAWGGEIFVPKIPSYRILDLAEAIAPSCKIETVGIRPGEKIHEEMVTESDSYSTVDLGDYYAILPANGLSDERGAYADVTGAKPVDVGFSVNSGKNDAWLNVEAIRDLIRAHIDHDFQPK